MLPLLCVLSTLHRLPIGVYDLTNRAMKAAMPPTMRLIVGGGPHDKNGERSSNGSKERPTWQHDSHAMIRRRSSCDLVSHFLIEGNHMRSVAPVPMGVRRIEYGKFMTHILILAAGRSVGRSAQEE